MNKKDQKLLAEAYKKVKSKTLEEGWGQYVPNILDPGSILTVLGGLTFLGLGAAGKGLVNKLRNSTPEQRAAAKKIKNQIDVTFKPFLSRLEPQETEDQVTVLGMLKYLISYNLLGNSSIYLINSIKNPLRKPIVRFKDLTINGKRFKPRDFLKLINAEVAVGNVLGDSEFSKRDKSRIYKMPSQLLPPSPPPSPPPPPPTPPQEPPDEWL